MTEFKYCVYCEEEPAICFDNEAEAMKFAREDTSMYKEVRVEKTEVDENGEALNSEVIWSASNAGVSEPEENLVKDNPFDNDFPESDISSIETSDDADYDEMAQQWQDYQDYVPADWDDPNRFPPKKEDLNVKEAVDNLEEHESEVECKHCFDLFPKEDCIKTEHGYLCKKCNDELHSHQGTNLDLIDADPFDLSYDDPRDPEEPEESEIKEEPVDETEIRKHEKAIEEESLEEHINEEHPAIESDQVLQGTDNAVVDCETDQKLIAHSEDEKPLDCKMEKAPLEEPLAGKEVDVKINEDVDLTEAEIKELDEDLKSIQEELVEAKKDDELPVDPEAAKLEVHTMLNDLVADEIEAINGYEEAKKEILDTPIAHKDNILDTIDHVEDEEKEHVDELIAATTEIPFDKEEAPASAVEEPVPVIEEEPVVEEGLKENLDVNSYRIVLADYNDDDGYDQEDVEYLLKPGQTKSDLVVYLSYKAGFIGVYVHDGRPATEDEIKQADYLGFETEPIPDGWSVEDFGDTDEDFEESLKNKDPFDQNFPKNEEKPLVEVAAPTPFDSDVQVGDKIKIGHLEGEDNSYDGKEGEVTHIDDIGQLHGTWGGLALIPGVDDFEVLKEELTEDVKKYAKVEDFLKKSSQWLDIDWETEKDICGVSISWDNDKNSFKAYTSIYHASEDNNAEYPEKHTEEDELSGDSLEELYAHLNDEFGEEFVKAFESELSARNLTEASSAEKRAFKNGGEDYQDLINGTAIGMIKDPKARAAAVAALKAGRQDLLKAYIGDRHEASAIDLLDKKQTAMANAGMTDESLKEDIKEDEVECGWCHEKFPEAECRYEKDFGYLCPQCEAALKSRGEELIFIEPAPKK